MRGMETYPSCLALSYDDDFVCSKHPKPNLLANIMIGSS